MAILSFLRRSRSASAAVLLGSVGFIATAGAFGACSKDATADVAKDAAATDAPARTPTYVAEVLGSYPHDPEAYTQGLLVQNGQLFEGTGLVGKSSIREVELQSGRVIRKRDVSEPYFGEGIVILGDDLIEITWQSGVAFVYDAKTFDPKKQFKYEGEGWGLTTDGSAVNTGKVSR